MSETSRRKFLAATGAGAAGAAGAMALGGAANAASADPHPEAARESVVAYIRDHRMAELHIFVGEREVVVHDRDLVTRLLNAAGGH